MKMIAEAMTLGALILMGTMAGFFFAFSNTVMPGFEIVNSVSAIEGMQGFNLVVRNPVFFVTFFLTPVIAIIAAVAAFLGNRRKAAVCAGAGAVIYIGGAFLVTVVHHIPLNETLGALDARALDGRAAETWMTYSNNWTPMNTVRAIACAVAMTPLTYGIVFLRDQETIA